MAFRPAWILSLGVAAVAPTLAYLGFWQLDRNAEMQAHKARLDQRLAQSVVEVDGLAGKPWPAPWRQVKVTGRFTGGQVWIINKFVGGAIGHRLVAAFQLKRGGIILIDRGWVPDGPIPDHIKSPEKRPEWRPPEGDWELQGLLRSWRPDVDAQVESLRFRSLDGGRIAKALGVPSAPYYLEQGELLEPGAEPNGFPRRGYSPFQIRSPHLSYAVQWFGLAVTLVIIYLVVGLQRGRASS